MRQDRPAILALQEPLEQPGKPDKLASQEPRGLQDKPVSLD